MKIIIVGDSRLGVELARTLVQEGNEVSIVCSDEKKIRHLSDLKLKKQVVGVEFDQDVLEKVGIKHVDGVIACTENDDTNALVARIARNVYRVPKVIARLYDQRKVDVYNALGIQVLATTQWGVERAKQLLTFGKVETVMSIGNNVVEIVRIVIPELLVGTKISDAFPLHDMSIVALTRENTSFIPDRSTKLEKGDILYLSAQAETLAQINHILEA